MKLKITFLLLLVSVFSYAQLPTPALVGYWQNWNDVNSPYIPLDQIDSRYNVIEISFAVPQAGTDYKMEFIPDQVSQATLITQIQTLQSQGKKVLISIGGATAPVSLDNISERDTFISTMNTIINTYGFDGIDIDLEGSSLSTSGGTISNPVDAHVVNLIFAIKQIMSDFYSGHGKKLFLTMAPETAFVHGGLSSYGGIWGGYLPVIEALRDSIEILQVQLYNSGSMYGIDGNIYTQGAADFIVAMVEAAILGFNTNGGVYSGLNPEQIAVALPACSAAAGGGYTDPAIVKSAIDYLRGSGPQPGTYTLQQIGGYSTLRGMMTWSINWDNVSSCGNADEFADNFELIFGTTTQVINNEFTNSFKVFPNPGNAQIKILNETGKSNIIKFYNSIGEIVMKEFLNDNFVLINIDHLPTGIYIISIGDSHQLFVKQ